jgi:hypothetical protein
VSVANSNGDSSGEDKGFSAQAVANILWGAAVLGVDPGQEFNNYACSRSVP